MKTKEKPTKEKIQEFLGGLGLRLTGTVEVNEAVAYRVSDHFGLRVWLRPGKYSSKGLVSKILEQAC